MHLFQGSQREIEELPGGGLSVSIELECNPVGRNRHCQPTIPAGGFQSFIITFRAHNDTDSEDNGHNSVWRKQFR